MADALDDCAALGSLQEQARTKVTTQTQLVSGLKTDDADRLMEERVLHQMRCNEAAIGLNLFLNDCDDGKACDVSH